MYIKALKEHFKMNMLYQQLYCHTISKIVLQSNHVCVYIIIISKHCSYMLTILVPAREPAHLQTIHQAFLHVTGVSIKQYIQAWTTTTVKVFQDLGT